METCLFLPVLIETVCLLKCITWKGFLLMLGPIDLYETEYYCALFVEITSCIMLKQVLKLGYRIVMTCGKELRTRCKNIVLKQNFKI